jgi:hypothetical protein
MQLKILILLKLFMIQHKTYSKESRVDNDLLYEMYRIFK